MIPLARYTLPCGSYQSNAVEDAYIMIFFVAQFEGAFNFLPPTVLADICPRWITHLVSDQTTKNSTGDR